MIPNSNILYVHTYVFDLAAAMICRSMEVCRVSLELCFSDGYLSVVEMFDLVN